jgi:peptidoglycan/xylan/chitin deacetylase (PgdA/CDA1 family)
MFLLKDMKNNIKKILILFFYNIFFWKRRYSNSFLVLAYHRITDKPDFQDPLKVSASNFEKQIHFLKEHYTIISGEELADIIKNNKPFPENSCLITFDDGWADNYTHAFPILKKHKVPAIIFITTDYIGTNKVFWHEKLANLLTRISSQLDINNLREILNKWPANVSNKLEKILKSQPQDRRSSINDLIIFLKSSEPQDIDKLIHELENLLGSFETQKNPLMLSWEQIQEMSQNNICFGSHTKSHAILTQISNDKAIEELRESKEIIEKRMNQPVYFFAYPNGNYNESIIRVAKEAGYLASFTCLRGVNSLNENIFELKRRHIREDQTLGLNGEFSGFLFKAELSSIRNYLKV